jgi:hypothetical protein
LARCLHVIGTVHRANGSPSRECLPDEFNGNERLLNDELMRKPQDGEAEPA